MEIKKKENNKLEEKKQQVKSKVNNFAPYKP
jgi:hypothetical protein